jgi:uncharacterized protein (DUF1810 family)
MTSPTDDPFQLRRFEIAQETVYPQALSELRAGEKRSHWMWFVFPQLDGLGSSRTARTYAIKSRDEAKAYLVHPVLGARLKECCDAILQVNGRNVSQILGYPDDLKLRSSMTLFSAVAADDRIFEEVLAKFFGGKADQRTLDLLGG